MNINLALVLCGGSGTRFGEDKPLYEYNGRTMISYVLESIKTAGVKKVILQANEKNKERIKQEAQRYFKDPIVLDNPTEKCRNVTEKLKDYLTEPYFLLVGNQPMRKDFLKNMKEFYESKNENCWITTIFPASISEIIEETKKISLRGDDRVVLGDSENLILHLPFIIDEDFRKIQSKENFRFKVDRTICNSLDEKGVYGYLGDMPPEFDNKEMVERTIEFIKSLN